MYGSVEVYHKDRLVYKTRNKIYPAFISKISNWLGSAEGFSTVPPPPLYCAVGIDNSDTDLYQQRVSLEKEVIRKKISTRAMEPIGWRVRLITNFTSMEGCFGWKEVGLFSSSGISDSVFGCNALGSTDSFAASTGLVTMLSNGGMYGESQYISRDIVSRGDGAFVSVHPYSDYYTDNPSVEHSILNYAHSPSVYHSSGIYTASPEVQRTNLDNLYLQFMIIPTYATKGTLSVSLKIVNSGVSFSGPTWLSIPITDLVPNEWNLLKLKFSDADQWDYDIGTGLFDISNPFNQFAVVSIGADVPNAYILDDVRVVGETGNADPLLARARIAPELIKDYGEALSLHWIVDPAGYII